MNPYPGGSRCGKKYQIRQKEIAMKKGVGSLPFLLLQHWLYCMQGVRPL